MKQLLYIFFLVFTAKQLLPSEAISYANDSTEESSESSTEYYTDYCSSFEEVDPFNFSESTEEEDITPASEQRKRIIEYRKELESTDSIPKNLLSILKVVIKKIPHAAFSPTILPCLLKLISEEQKGIKGACYEFDDMIFAKAWVNRKKKQHISGFLVLNRVQLKDKPKAKNIARYLSENKIKVYQNTQRYTEKNIRLDDGSYLNYGTTNRHYDENYDEDSENKQFYEIMHHKFFIFRKNETHGKIIVTGSFNWTENANDRNWENIVILNDKETIKKFEEQWLELKEHREEVKL